MNTTLTRSTMEDSNNADGPDRSAQRPQHNRPVDSLPHYMNTSIPRRAKPMPSYYIPTDFQPPEPSSWCGGSYHTTTAARQTPSTTLYENGPEKNRHNNSQQQGKQSVERDDVDTNSELGGLLGHSGIDKAGSQRSTGGGGSKEEAKARIQTVPPQIIEDTGYDNEGMPEIDFDGPTNNVVSAMAMDKDSGGGGDSVKDVKKDKNSDVKGNLDGNAEPAASKRVKHDRSTWCTACQWIQRTVSQTKAKGCDGGKPCSQCVIAMKNRNSTWECTYEGKVNFKNTGNHRIMPDIYRKRPVKTIQKNPPSAATTVPDTAKQAVTKVKEQINYDDTVAANTQDTRHSSSSASVPGTLSPYFTHNTPPPTSPVYDQDTAMTPNSNTTTTTAADNQNISSVYELLSAMHSDISFYKEFLSYQQHDSEIMKPMLERYIHLYEERLQDPLLAIYVDREKRILHSGIPQEMKEGLVQANLNDCMREKNWRGGEE